ncbi:helix-turn-helix domain-containing protein [Achromobacter sp. ES-001]|uniref:helix-turn-helix domain-containing protein n=1 Tax=Achromobacter sp. ES-001 TaxID=2860286 RepID=UPI001C63CC8C|nr:helix-turn-helix transcriptional regulator [Achromobacter sp. ES-001]QYJ20164.1 helix-turn-helix domain-containing protein [Achromobacter sp. ES-001]
MALTEFGKAVRKARIDTGQTLLSMATALGTTASFLSAMETGRKKIADQWIAKIDHFFRGQGRPVARLHELAAVANQAVPLDGLPLQQQMLVAGFAKSSFTAEELQTIADLLGKINNDKKGEDERADSTV